MKRNLNGESFSVNSNSRGDLLKTEYSDGGVMHFVKTGRIQVRDFPGYWGIEPVVEVICSRLGAKMGLDMASQCLDVLDVVRYGKKNNDSHFRLAGFQRGQDDGLSSNLVCTE